MNATIQPKYVKLCSNQQQYDINYQNQILIFYY